LGLVGVAAPAVLLELARSLIVPPALYGVAVVRVAFGVLLILVATGSRLPRTLRLVGAFIVVAGLLTPFLGAIRIDEALTWFSANRTTLFRLLALLPILAGAFLVYAINPSRGRSGDNAA
jgi:hypothetical protein